MRIVNGVEYAGFELEKNPGIPIMFLPEVP